MTDQTRSRIVYGAMAASLLLDLWTWYQSEKHAKELRDHARAMGWGDK